MQFDWNNSNIQHIARHDVAPEEAEQVIQNEPVDAGVALRNNEERTLHLGETNVGRVLFVVATERMGLIRVVTARPARRSERDFYLKHKVATNDQDSQDP